MGGKCAKLGKRISLMIGRCRNTTATFDVGSKKEVKGYVLDDGRQRMKRSPARLNAQNESLKRQQAEKKSGKR